MLAAPLIQQENDLDPLIKALAANEEAKSYDRVVDQFQRDLCPPPYPVDNGETASDSAFTENLTSFKEDFYNDDDANLKRDMRKEVKEKQPLEVREHEEVLGLKCRKATFPYADSENGPELKDIYRMYGTAQYLSLLQYPYH